MNYYQPHAEDGVVVLRLPVKPDAFKKAEALTRMREIADEKSDPFAYGWRPNRGNPNKSYKRSRIYREGGETKTSRLL